MITEAYDHNPKLDASIVKAEIKQMMEQRQRDIVLLGEDNNLRALYNTMSHLVDKHGENLCKDMNCVLVYEIDMGNTTPPPQNSLPTGE